MGDIRLGSKVCSGCRMLKITIGVTGLGEDSGRDDGIKENLILRALTLVQRLYCLFNLAPRLSILTREEAGKRVLSTCVY